MACVVLVVALPHYVGLGCLHVLNHIGLLQAF